MKVAIVGGGLSLQEVAIPTIPPEHDITIAINSTAWLMPCDYCFTISTNFAERVDYAEEKPFEFILASKLDNPRKSLHLLSGDTPVSWGKARVYAEVDNAKVGFSEEQGVVHGGNSAYSALNWAYLLGATEVSLFGLDGTDYYRIGVDGRRQRSGVHSHLPFLFESAMPQIEQRGIKVVNYSPNSLVTCFPRSEWPVKRM